MGNRANIGLVKGERTPIYVYSHWGGSELPQHLAVALDRARPRWSDPSYANRMVINTLIPEFAETGFGIDTATGDDNYGYVFVVQWDTGQVVVVPYDWPNAKLSQPVVSWTFEEFISRRPSWGDIDPQ